jgi:heavy metal translocating P-type ATPase
MDSDNTREHGFVVFSRSSVVMLLRPVLAFAGIVLGFALGDARWAIWITGLVAIGGVTVVRTALDVARGRFASDIVAALAIVGALVFDQPLAGLIVVLMQTGGEALEHWAEGRASAAVRALEDSAPRIAHRVHDDGVDDITVDKIAVGDRCLVRPGEMVPCDGVVDDEAGDVDLARITGEPVPEHVVQGDEVRSGSVVVARPLVIRSTALAGESLYARIVELVREAQGAKAPLQRLADKWAMWFTPFTLLACAATYLVTHDTHRLLAVLVVATPCPLILAAPIAIIGGINRIARHRVIVRTGGALERLASIDSVALDKTGTLTVGHPEVHEIRPAAGVDPDTVLALAAAVEHASGHPMARSVVKAAEARGLVIAEVTDAHEESGSGAQGMVAGKRVSIGSPRWARELNPAAAAAMDDLPPPKPTETIAAVTVDGEYVGAVVFADTLRPGLAKFFVDLAAIGVTRTVLLSGDRTDRVEQIAHELGVAEARGDLLPDGKVAAIKAMVAEGHRVAMIGDGVNDAPALSAATVGIALAAHGGGIAAQSADCVLLADDLSIVAVAVRVAHRTLGIARQSVYAGLGLSVVAMGFAAAGELSPVAGAMVQEAIDVAVILNAIRAAGNGTANGRVDEKASRRLRTA